MKTLTFCLIFSCFLAFGQRNDVQKLDRHAAAQAWSAANVSLPDNTPSISGGGLVIESEVNGVGRKVWLIATQSGSYLLQGKTCGGEDVRLGELGWEASQYSSSMIAMIFDTSAMTSALPFFPQICTIEVLRIDKGRIERSSTEVNPWQPQAPKLQIGAEGITNDGHYYVSTSTLPGDAIVVLGRSMVAEVRSTPFGSTVLLPANTYLPPAGVTTLTVCSKGRCNTTAFERKLSVETPGGKG